MNIFRTIYQEIKSELKAVKKYLADGIKNAKPVGAADQGYNRWDRKSYIEPAVPDSHRRTV